MKAILVSETRKALTYPLCVIGLLGTLLLPLTLQIFSHATTGQCCELGELSVILLGAGVMGQEWEAGCWRTTLLTNARRNLIVCAKIIVLIILVLSTWTLDIYALTLAGSHRFHNTTWWGMAWSWLMLAMLSFTITAAVANSVFAIAILVPLILGVSRIIASLTHAAYYLPDLAALRAFGAHSSEGLPSPFAGVMVQTLWVVILSGPMIWRLRQDVH